MSVHFDEPGNSGLSAPNYARVACDYVVQLGGRPCTDRNTPTPEDAKTARDHLDSALRQRFLRQGVHHHRDGLRGLGRAAGPPEAAPTSREAR